MPANSSFTEISAITYRHFKNKYVTDNVSNHTALHQRLTEKDRVDLISGGWEIQVPLDYAENGTYQRYSGYDTLDIAQSEVFTAANFAWKQVAINVVASGLEIRQNSGKEGIIKLVKNKLKNAMKTAGNNFSVDIYSDGTAANQVNGLQALVSDAGTGTVGGINSSTYTFWKSGLQSAAAPIQGGGAITPSSTTIESLMLPLWLQLTRNNDQPDLIVMDDTYFTFFDNSQTSIQRYTNTTDLKTGTTSLKYKGADVVYDSLAAGMPDQHAYFLNTDYIGICAHRDANWTEVPRKIVSESGRPGSANYLAGQYDCEQSFAARRNESVTRH